MALAGRMTGKRSTGEMGNGSFKPRAMDAVLPSWWKNEPVNLYGTADVEPSTGKDVIKWGRSWHDKAAPADLYV